jgi:hypothetical protein
MHPCDERRRDFAHLAHRSIVQVQPVGTGKRGPGDDVAVHRLPHGYTNFTRLTGGQVEKTYDGPRRRAHSTRELACLQGLAGRRRTEHWTAPFS